MRTQKNIFRCNCNCTNIKRLGGHVDDNVCEKLNKIKRNLNDIKKIKKYMNIHSKLER